MSSDKDLNLNKKLDQTIALLQQLVAINMYMHGATKEEIAKNLRVRKATIVYFLKGMKADKPK